MSYNVVAFYHFVSLENPQLEVAEWKRFCASIFAKGRIYLSKDGVNAQMSVPESRLTDLKQWLESSQHWKGIKLKIDFWHEHAFEKLTIKSRSQLAAMDVEVDLSRQGEALSPHQWEAMLQKKEGNTVVLDVRNKYEWEAGHFEGAVQPTQQCFREFPKYAEKLKEELDEDTPVMMYCTGGIRCELFSALLKEKGFKRVYQLDGGVVEYGKNVGSKHWKGKLFVFDDRLTVPISQEPAEVISKCLHCQTENDTYHNCANMDCNDLFFCCKGCLIQWKGCCSESCYAEGRVRPLEDEECPKPFRKLPFNQKKKL